VPRHTGERADDHDLREHHPREGLLEKATHDPNLEGHTGEGNPAG
jgi:hypothetical protein